MSIKDQILNHLKLGNTLTLAQAQQQFGYTYLPRAINALKKEGHPIQAEYLTSPTGKKYTVYSLPVSHWDTSLIASRPIVNGARAYA